MNDVSTEFVPGEPVDLSDSKQVYQYKKYLGLRRSSGHINLKRLSPNHLRIIGLHLQGISNAEIAERMNCSANLVTRTLTDPLAVEVIEERKAATVQEMSALNGLAVKELRRILAAEDVKDSVKLQAVKLVLEHDPSKLAERKSDLASVIGAILQNNRGGQAVPAPEKMGLLERTVPQSREVVDADYEEIRGDE